MPHSTLENEAIVVWPTDSAALAAPLFQDGDGTVLHLPSILWRATLGRKRGALVAGGTLDGVKAIANFFNEEARRYGLQPASRVEL